MKAFQRFFGILKIIVQHVGVKESLTIFFRMMRLQALRAERKYFPEDGPQIPEVKPEIKQRPSREGLRVLILNGFPEDWALYRYRIKQKIEQLNSVGVDVKTIHFDAPDVVPQAMDYSHVIWYRLPITERLIQLQEKSKSNGTKLIYDIDDLIFDLEVCQQIDGIQILNEVDKEKYLQNMARLAEAMKLCDYGLVTTTPLKEKLEEMGLKAYVHRNGFEKEMYEISERVIAGKIEKSRVLISYQSGSNTHNRDFQVCTEALANVLKKYKNVRLYVFGWLTVDGRLKPFENKIVRIPFMPWKELAIFTKDMDINLCPLEDNIFCNNKSELKYLEAAILEVPTIASPRSAFSEVIKHGKNGFLAETTEEWIQCLDLLINDGETRKAVGRRAREHVLQEYDIQKMGKGLADFLKSI
jgi:glycosyltransferase involved in cell wall biosynthesis